MIDSWYETANLALDHEGILYHKVIGGDGEDDECRRLGRVEDVSFAVPDGLEDEYDEILDEWAHADTREALHAEWNAGYYRNLL